MAASVQFRPQERTLGMVMNEVDKDLALFLEMRRHENERDTEKLDEFDDSTGNANSDNCLNPGNVGSASNKNDYDWLLTPPDAPLFPFVELDKTQPLEVPTGISNAQPTASKSKATNSQEDSVSHGCKSTSSSIQTSGTGLRRPSSSGGKRLSSSRPATPTGRPSLPAMVKPTRATTPTSRATVPLTKTVTPPVRSSTPTRATARSSTPTARSSAPATSKLTSRSSTPTRKSNNPSLVAPSDQSSSGAKAGPTTLKNPAASRGTSPTFKSRPSMPSETPGLSRDAPNMTKRPSSASKVRPSAPVARSSSTDTSSKGKSRQQSCSPSRGRVSIGSSRSLGSAILSRSLGHNTISDDVNPVLMGTKMVERVVNMRKLAPPKQNNHLPQENFSKKPSSSQESLGFGRSLSKKSLDMAIRHMDITRSFIDDQRALATNAHSVNGRSRSQTVGASGSSDARSRTASSEPRIGGKSDRTREIIQSERARST